MDEDERLIEDIKKRYEDMQVSLSDLRNPTRKFVHQYFLRYFEEFGADVSALMEPSSEQLQALEYPAAFMGVLQLANNFCAVKYIFQYIASNINISITDLTEPNPNKTKLLIKCAEEFYKYADLKTSELLIPIETKVLQKKAFYEQLRSEIEASKEYVNKRASEKAQLHMHIQQLSGQIAAHDATSIELRMQCLNLDEDNKDFEAEMARSKTVLEEVQAEKVQLAETLKEVEFEASQLPTEATLAAIKEEKATLEKNIAFFIKRAEEIYARIADAENKFKLWEVINPTVQEAVAIRQELQSVNTKREEVEKQQASDKEEQEADKEKSRKFHAKIAQFAELRASCRAQWLEKRAVLKKKIEEEKGKNEIFRGEKVQSEKKKLKEATVKEDEEVFKLADETIRTCRSYDEKFKKLEKEQEEILRQIRKDKNFTLSKEE